jgi:Cu(I)/Ag(I) efflux system membrane fusion protein
MFTLYSPDLFEAQQAYVDALENLENARKLRSPLSADLAIEVRRRRLRLSDLGPDELERLEERGLPVELVPILAPASGHVIEKNVVAGAAVSPGTRLLRIAGLERVWVEAEVYESELGLLAVGDAATVTLPHLPGRSFDGRIAFIYPWLDGATRTGRVRIELANPGLALKPEMYAEVVFEPALGERLAVPEEAILYAGDRHYVFLDLGDGRLRPQAVTLGQRAGEWVEVLDGLTAGEAVVTSGNFLIAAEARLKLALDHWSEPPG